MSSKYPWKAGDIVHTPGGTRLVLVCDPYKEPSCNNDWYVRYRMIDKSSLKTTIIACKHCKYVGKMSDEELLTNQEPAVRAVALRKLKIRKVHNG